MPEDLTSVEIAAQCWCDPRTSDRVMDVALAQVFAEKLEALREQLAEAQSSASIRVNKALAIVNEHLSSDPTVAALQEQLAAETRRAEEVSAGWTRTASELANAKNELALAKKQLTAAIETIRRLQPMSPMPPYDACSPLHDHERIDYNGEEQDGS